MPREDFARENFARNLKDLRKKEGLTQDLLGEALGVDRSTYAYYEGGKTCPDLKTVCRLAGIFRITPNDLLGQAAKVAVELHDTPLQLEDEDPISRFSMLTREEQVLLLRYRQLGDEERRAVQEELKNRLD